MANDNKFNIDEDKPADWFEPLYANAESNGEGVPWANMSTHPSFAAWLERHPLTGEGKTALVVGCGMGDDAIELEKRGFDVTAFDVSETAIGYCKQRFPDSTVSFQQADLLAGVSEWKGAFDFVLEIFTVQALPPKYEKTAIDGIAGFVASSGSVLVVAEVEKGPRDFAKGPPWLLTPEHLQSFVDCGFTIENQHVEASSLDETRLGLYVTEFKRTSR